MSRDSPGDAALRWVPRRYRSRPKPSSRVSCCESWVTFDKEDFDRHFAIGQRRLVDRALVRVEVRWRTDSPHDEAYNEHSIRALFIQSP
jgi:hypothetical protein